VITCDELSNRETEVFLNGNPELQLSHVLIKAIHAFNGTLHIPVPPVSDGLVVSDALVAGEEVWMLPVDDF